jgi:hypothetical protein
MQDSHEIAYHMKIFIGASRIMTIQVSWYEAEKRNIVYTFVGSWSWAECHAAMDKAAFLIDTVDYSVVQIVDLRQTFHAPSITLDGLSYIAKSAAPNHARAKGVIVIGLKGSVLIAFNIFKQIFPEAATRYILARNEADLAKLLNLGETVG